MPLLALCLAMVGIYGVMSYSVEQRTSEFGIKMALGAQQKQLLLQVLGQGLTPWATRDGCGIPPACPSGYMHRAVEALRYD